jgi:hypothetical protein
MDFILFGLRLDDQANIADVAEVVVAGQNTPNTPLYSAYGLKAAMSTSHSPLLSFSYDIAFNHFPS